jgi:hypothetical protein
MRRVDQVDESNCRSPTPLIQESQDTSAGRQDQRAKTTAIEKLPATVEPAPRRRKRCTGYPVLPPLRRPQSFDNEEPSKKEWPLKPEEEKKVLVSTSRRISFTRVGAHLLPASITIFLIGFNAFGFLNGPQITTPAAFFLQVASKFHVRGLVPLRRAYMFFGYQEVLYPHWQTKLTSLQELTIGGSLAVVVLDVIRHQLYTTGSIWAC